MSTEDQAGAGRREVAYRVFAAEYDDADFEYTENEDDERSPNYVVTPTGARVNRLFAVGVLTEVERVNEEMLRGRVVDPTGAFVIYAGQYQPDPLTALERADPPAFVAVTGKARTFQPEDADAIYTSIRPETINEVDAETRDRWTVDAARHTLDRVATFTDALEREERGDDLTAALESGGVDSGLAAGIPLAIEHYGTTTAYLDAVREMAVGAAEVVAGEREEVESLDLVPDEGGATEIAIDAETSFAAAGVEGGESETAEGETGTTEAPAAGTEDSTAATGSETSEDAAERDLDDLGDFDAGGEEPADETTAPDDSGESEEPAAATDEMYEFDEDEREEIEEEFGTEFSTGSEIEDPGEADLDASAPEEAETTDAETIDADDEPEPAEPEPEPVEPEEEQATEPEAEETDADEEKAETGQETESGAEAADVDLEEAVVDAMRDLDSGDGAERAEVIETVSEAHGASEEDVADAIQDALMSGKCYEPGDGLLKAI